jgi:hypothetical protein
VPAFPQALIPNSSFVDLKKGLNKITAEPGNKNAF